MQRAGTECTVITFQARRYTKINTPARPHACHMPTAFATLPHIRLCCTIASAPVRALANSKHVNHETGSPKALTTVHASLQLPGVRDDRALRGAPAPRAGLLHSVDDGLAGRDAAEDHVLSWLGLGIRLGLGLGLG